MRIRVRHETRYTYRQPAQGALQLLRLTPRSHDGQFVRRWRFEISTDYRMTRDEDAYGNIVHLAFIDGPIQDLRISVEGEVDTRDTHGLVRGSIERQPERLYLRQTPLTRPPPPLREIAQDLLAGQGGDKLATLHKVMAAIAGAMRFEIGSSSVGTTAAEAWAAGSGVCQDFAHVFLAASRAIAIPARYVSGYYLRSDTSDQEAGHAWAEAFVDGLGWVGFDPAHNICVTDRFVRVAVGCDYLEASPVRGARIGGGGEELAVAIDVRPGQAIVEG